MQSTTTISNLIFSIFILLFHAKNDVTASSLIRNIVSSSSSSSSISNYFFNWMSHKDKESSSSSRRKLSTNNIYTNDNFFNCLQSIEVDLSLQEYLTILITHGHHDHIVIFLWNSSGHLINHTPIVQHKGWLNDDLISTTFNYTEPSEYGKVAILYNSDVVHKIEMPAMPESPPVPVLLYTTPDSKEDIETIITIPTAYELNNLVQKTIETIQNTLNETFILSKDIFFSRKSVLVWRGSVHHKADTSRNKLLEIGNNNTSSSSNNKNEWLDVNTGEIFHTKYVPEYMIQNYKYHIDIGGVSGTSWCGLRWKMCSGGLVFKVDTWSKDLWHTTIEPWKHYIPIQDDLSDIYDMYTWAENNPNEAYKIASNGQKKCLESYTTQYAHTTLTNIITHKIQPSSKETIDHALIYFKLNS